MSQPDDEDPDLGPPLEMLQEYGLSEDPAFEGRVHRRIERRQLSSDLADLAWTGPILLISELLKALLSEPPRPGAQPQDAPDPDPQDRQE